MRLKVVDSRLHGLCGLQDFGHDQLVVVEEPAHLLHAVHKRAVDYLERGHVVGELLVEVGQQPLLAALDDVPRQPLIQWQVLHFGPLMLHGSAKVFCDLCNVELVQGRLVFGSLLAVVLRRFDAIAGQVAQQPVRQPLLLFGDRGEAAQLFRVHDRQVEPSPGGMVQEHCVDHFAGRRWEPEANVAHSEQRFHTRQLGLDQPQGLNGLDGAADVVDVARAAWEHQRVEHHILFRNLPFLGEQTVRALGDCQLALPSDCLGLLGILVDRADDHGCAVAAQQGHDLIKALLAVLEVDRVHDGLALAVRQGALHRNRIGTVDHEGGLDLLDQQLVERIDVRQLVAVGVFEIDINDLRAAAHLGAADLGGLFKPLFRYEPLEAARSDHVGPLAHQQRPVVITSFHDIDASKLRAPGGLVPAGGVSLRHLSDSADMLGSCAAAAADDVEPAIPHESFQYRRQRIGRLPVQPILVGQAGIWITRHERRRSLVNRSNVVRHVFRTRGAIEADAQRLGVLQRHNQGFGGLPGQHRAHGLDGARDDHWNSQAVLAQSLSNADERGLDIAGVLTSFEDQQIRVFGQGEGLIAVGGHQFGERHSARDGDRLGRGPHGTGYEARPATSGVCIGRFPRQAAGLGIDASNLSFEAVLCEHDVDRAERVRFDNVRTGLAVVGMDLAHNIGPGEHDVLVAAL